MKKTKSVIPWVLLNGGMATLVYLSIFTEHKSDAGLVNVTKFVLWICSIVSWLLVPLFLVAAAVSKPSDEHKLPTGKFLSPPAWISHCFDMVVVIVCVYGGWIWTASFYFTHIFAQSFSVFCAEYAAKKQNPESK